MKKLFGAWMPRLVLTLGFGLVACGGGSNPPPGPTDTGVVAGLVTDISNGARLAGVKVTLVGGSTTVNTDSKGEFALSNLATGTINFSLEKTGFAPSYASAEVGNTAQTVLVSLKKEGSRQTYDASQTKTLIQRTEAGPYAVIFTAGSLDTSDTNLKVSITPLDPTKELSALPGELATSSTPLSAVTFAEFTIYDSSGKKVNLKAGANAMVELPIPADLRVQYPLGAIIHCYAYNPQTGKWEDFVEGTVVTSSVDNSTPVLRAQIRHFSWYGGAPEVKKQRCARVKVRSALTGAILEGARVTASPGLSATTNANGSANITVEDGVPVTFTASRTYPNSYVENGIIVTKPGFPGKVIEIGKVTRLPNIWVDDPGKPCTKPAAQTPEPPTRDAADGLEIVMGLAPDAVYQAFGQLNTSGFSLILQKGIPNTDGGIDEPEAAGGAKIMLSDGSTSVNLQEIPSGQPNVSTGYYSLPTVAPTLSIQPGGRYTVTIDGDANGTIDGSGSASVVGHLAFSNIVQGGQYTANGFTVAWTDSGTATPGYNVLYQVLALPKNAQQSSSIGFYTGSSLSASLGVIDFANPGGLPQPLTPGNYSISLTGFSGGFAAATGFSQSDNITGVGVSGQLFSFGSVPQVDVTLK